MDTVWLRRKGSRERRWARANESRASGAEGRRVRRRPGRTPPEPRENREREERARYALWSNTVSPLVFIGQVLTSGSFVFWPRGVPSGLLSPYTSCYQKPAKLILLDAPMAPQRSRPLFLLDQSASRGWDSSQLGINEDHYFTALRGDVRRYFVPRWPI